MNTAMHFMINRYYTSLVDAIHLVLTLRLRHWQLLCVRGPANVNTLGR